MGLEERRIVNDIVTNTIAGMQERLQQIDEMNTLVEIDWDSFTQADANTLYFLRNYIEKIESAIGCIALEPIGRGAIAAGMSKIFIRQVPDNSAVAVTFAEGVLTTHANFSDVEGIPSEPEVQKAIEDGL